MNPALILIDIQNDYFPGGKMEVVGSVEAGLAARDVLSLFRRRRLPLVHIQHFSVRPGASFFLPETKGVEIHETVEPLAGETVFPKNLPNAFRNTPLLEHLKGLEIDHVVVVGMMTHMCVDATTRAAFDHGFGCTVVHDACAARALPFGGELIPAEHVHKAFLSALGSVYARVVGAADLLREFPR
ncbi:MAG TPA: cysteine hydrolase family protein [Syntrophobacter fumaroxidans]|nr:cysteine hydrolase family protein [Syntrophobacter fumaroxidans]